LHSNQKDFASKSLGNLKQNKGEFLLPALLSLCQTDNTLLINRVNTFSSTENGQKLLVKMNKSY
jgi:hypothetical protein